MRNISFGSKHKNPLANESFVQYLILPSEPAEASSIGPMRESFAFRNRYLAKRQVMRTIRRLRRTQA
ncbi:MAG TPA: hypothetical protein VMB52_03980 [Verrucomicrobiae bacterium]|nr:hypothetical protein [Verrucomicrobiae bacterium]